MSVPSRQSDESIGKPGLSKRDFLQALIACQEGEALQLPDGLTGVDGEIAAQLHSLAQSQQTLASELRRVCQSVQDGDFSQRLQAAGLGKNVQENARVLNEIFDGLVIPGRQLTQVLTALSRGEFPQANTWVGKTGSLQGEPLAAAQSARALVEELRQFTAETGRVLRALGREGKLGQRAEVKGLSGQWREIAEEINHLDAAIEAQVKALMCAAKAVTKGDYCQTISVSAHGDLACLRDTLNGMIRSLCDTTKKHLEQDWLKTNLAKFSRRLQGQKDLQTIGKSIFSDLATVVSATHAVFYLVDNSGEEPELKLQTSFACTPTCKAFLPSSPLTAKHVERCVAAKKKLVVNAQVDGCVHGGSNTQQTLTLLLLPVMFKGELKAVLELASPEGFSSADEILLEELAESLGIVLHTIENDLRTQQLLKESQKLATESRRQQEQLQKANQDLEEKARLLAVQMSEAENKNRELEQARQALREKATQLSQISKYKSEFLANMSHELRTPLNSMLLLARQLSENHEGTMTDKQLEFAKVIHAAGNELLRLINDILDLSKIESGTVTVDVGELQFWELQAFVERNFRVLAKNKNLEFSIDVAPALPPTMLTDGRRLEQVLKNLLANAFKFTERGSVRLSISPVTSGWSPDNTSLNNAQSVVAFAVSDTGIGIAESKQKLIFEAFQQADGSTNRKFGGTGLGLTISREIARLLGGEIGLKSVRGVGTVFTLYVPLQYGGGRAMPTGQESDSIQVEVLLRGERSCQDDRDKIQPGDLVLLAIEDDLDFAGCLLDRARETGFKVLAANHGEDAQELVRQFHPSAITLDSTLPDMDAWRVLEMLKDDPATRHIPVLVISGEDESARGLRLGAVEQLLKPVSIPVLKAAVGRLKALVESQQKTLLLVKHDKGCAALAKTLSPLVKVVVVNTGEAALAWLKQSSCDCVVADLALPDMSGLHLLEEVKKLRVQNTPVLLHAGRELNIQETVHLSKLQRKLVVKSIMSSERLFDQITLHLHLATASLPEAERRIIQNLHVNDTVLAGKRVLIVDDDIRNIFALTSLLERHGMQITSVENGLEAIKVLGQNKAVDVILMDIMMPRLDGYKTTAILREKPGFHDIPIIAVTAKAMKEDRLKCLEAGASDYLPKPVDAQQLLSTLRAWLHR